MLCVQICAYNEAATIQEVIHSIPRSIPGIAQVIVVVVDDGSTDGTAAQAQSANADHIIRHRRNRGLARSFQNGVDYCLQLGADIIVNLDADGQYRGEEIPALIAPILSGQAEIVVGDRQVSRLRHFSAQKRLLQKLGSWVVRQAAGVDIPDAVSGFRAYSREAALRLFVTAQFSYTVQTLIQAGMLGLAVTSVPITAQHTARPSRLHRGNAHFILQQVRILLHTYTVYKPLKFFLSAATPFLLVGVALLGRLLIRFAEQGWQLPGNVQSLVIGAVALAIGMLLVTTGVIADRLRANHQLVEEALYRLRKQETLTTHRR